MDLLPVERLLVSLVLVARPGNEVVPGQLLHRATTQPARAAVNVAHAPMLASAEVAPSKLIAATRSTTETVELSQQREVWR